MSVRTVAVYLILSVTLLTSADALFENVGTCDPSIVDGLKQIWNGNIPSNVLQQFKDVQPWSVVYVSTDLFPVDTKSVVIDTDNIKVIPESESDAVNVPLSWKEDRGVLTDKQLQWYVLVLETNSFGFYVCSSEGTSTSSMGGVAMAMGPPGGIPDETKLAALDAKKQLEKLGVKLQTELDLSSG